MKITDIRLDSYTPKDSGTCAVATIVFDNQLVVHYVRVINGHNGLFVAMPNTGNTKMCRNKKRYMDLVHPNDKKLSDEITSQVLSVYKSRS